MTVLATESIYSALYRHEIHRMSVLWSSEYYSLICRCVKLWLSDRWNYQKWFRYSSCCISSHKLFIFDPLTFHGALALNEMSLLDGLSWNLVLTFMPPSGWRILVILWLPASDIIRSGGATNYFHYQLNWCQWIGKHIQRNFPEIKVTVQNPLIFSLLSHKT